MSPKEQLYIKDVVGHAQFMEQQCRQAAAQVTDPGLKQLFETIATRHKTMHDNFNQL